MLPAERELCHQTGVGRAYFANASTARPAVNAKTTLLTECTGGCHACLESIVTINNRYWKLLLLYKQASIVGKRCNSKQDW